MLDCDGNAKDHHNVHHQPQVEQPCDLGSLPVMSVAIQE